MLIKCVSLWYELLQGILLLALLLVYLFPKNKCEGTVVNRSDKMVHAHLSYAGSFKSFRAESYDVERF